MQRIMVIGPCGSGKSTLARRLGERLGIPAYHLDKIMWSAGWIEREEREWSPELDAIVARDRWVIDGNDSNTMAVRLERADKVVYLDFAPWRCLWRVLVRIATMRGETRPDMAEDCPERLDFGFLWYVATWHRKPRRRTEATLAGFKHKIVRLRTPSALERWMDSLPRP